MSLVSELKRRNVFRVALAYLAASWLVIQVTETIFPLFGLPDLAIRVIIVLLAVGFIPALVVAWLFEITPDGLLRESDVDRSRSIATATGKKLDRTIIIVLIIAIVYFAVDKFVFTSFRLESARLEGRSEALVENYGDKSIVVLPFADMSAAGDQEYMSDGLAEELLNLLAAIPELRVISRSSAFSFKGRMLDVRSIASQLNVNYALEGSVRKAGSRLRITAQLIDARTDTHIWSESWDRELDDIFAIQDEIAENVVERLEVTILGEPPSPRETDPEAYALFLQGRYLHEQPGADSFRRAFEYYEAALAIDESYVPAWVWLAALYDDTAGSHGLPFDEVGLLAKNAIERALAIDPDDPLALGMSAIIVEAWDHDLETASARMQAALDRDPGNAILLRWAALLLPSFGQYELAVRVNEHLFALDPVGHIAKINLASSYLNAGRYADAVEICKVQLAMASGRGPCRLRVVLGRLFMGEADAALQIMETMDKSSSRSWLEPMAYHALGRTDDYEAAMTALELVYAAGQARIANRLAMVAAYAGDADNAFAWLDRALEDGVFDVSPDSVYFANIHADPRWRRVMERAGMPRERLEQLALDIRLRR